MITDRPSLLARMTRPWVPYLTALLLVLGTAAWSPTLSQAQTPSKPGKKAPKASSLDTNETLTTPPPQEFELARVEHHRQLLEASLAPLKTALSKLDELAITSARARDYPAAIAARGEREQIVTDLDRIAKELLLLDTRKQVLEASLLPDHILLPLTDAKLEGVRFDEGKKALTHWDRPGTFAEWTLPRIPPGGYELLLTYHCNPLEGGTLVVNEQTFSLSGEMDTTLRGPEVKNLGTLKITDGNGPLRLTARTVVKNNLMDLIAVELVPANR